MRGLRRLLVCVFVLRVERLVHGIAIPLPQREVRLLLRSADGASESEQRVTCLSPSVVEPEGRPYRMTFDAPRTPGDWDVPQMVTVTGVDDGAADGDVAYTIVTAAAISGDVDYDGLDAADVQVALELMYFFVQGLGANYENR